MRPEDEHCCIWRNRTVQTALESRLCIAAGLGGREQGCWVETHWVGWCLELVRCLLGEKGRRGERVQGKEQDWMYEEWGPES